MRSAWLLLVLAGCQTPSKQSAPVAASASAPAASASVAAAPLPWFEGKWQGTFAAELQRIELSVGGVKAWKEDDGKQASGEGKLALEAKNDGSVTGIATGALGELALSGQVEGDRLALTFRPSEPNGFQGTILAAQAPEGIKGTLSASTGDSLSVRKASITLVKASQ